MEFGIDLPQEKLDRENSIQELESTPGWQALSQEQQKEIQRNLYIQKRAERVKNWSDKCAVVSRKNGYDVDGPNCTRIRSTQYLEKMHIAKGYPDPKRRTNPLSQEYVSELDCYDAVERLEGGRTEGMDGLVKSGFFEASFLKNTNIKDLKQKILEIGFPCVVFTCTAENHFSPYDARHAFVVMGENKRGDWMIYHKNNPGEQFETNVLDEIYSSRQHESWGLRKLRDKRRRME